jgi:hypothetical protein
VDPDPYQNVMDPQHCFYLFKTVVRVFLCSLMVKGTDEVRFHYFFLLVYGTRVRLPEHFGPDRVKPSRFLSRFLVDDSKRWFLLHESSFCPCRLEMILMIGTDRTDSVPDP